MIRRHYDWRPMPVYEFECEECGGRFEELTSSDTRSLACPECGSGRTRRMLSPVSPAGRQPRGAGVRSDESQRRDREAARGERLAETRRKRAAGEL
jgi:putative FmdB family regulatory protein